MSLICLPTPGPVHWLQIADDDGRIEAGKIDDEIITNLASRLAVEIAAFGHVALRKRGLS